MVDHTDTPTSDVWLRLGDAADRLGVGTTTLRRWADTGRVPCYRSPGGHRRFLLSDLNDVLRRSTSTGPDPPPTDLEEAGTQPASTRPRWSADALPRHASHLANLARSVVSGLDLGISVIAAVLPGRCSLKVHATFPPDGIPSLGLSTGDVVPLRMVPLAETVLSSDTACVVDDLSAIQQGGRPEIDYLRHVLGIRMLLAIPFPSTGEPAGLVLAAGSNTQNTFSTNDVAFAAQIARQAAVACAAPRVGRGSPAPHAPVGPPRASDSPPSTTRSTGATPPALAERSSAKSRPDPTLARVAASAAALLHAGRATVYRRRGEEWAPAVSLSTDASGSAVLDSLPPSPPADAILDRFSLAARPGLLNDGGDPALAVPLILSSRQLGVLVLRDLPDETPSDPMLLRHLAILAAAFLDEHDAADILRRRIHELAGVIDATVEDRALLGYSATLRATAERLAELARVPVVDIYALEGRAIRALVSYDSGSFDPGWEGVVLPLDRYPCSKQAVASQTVVSAAGLDDPILTPEGRSSLEKWGYKSQLSIPLIACGKVIGLAELSDRVARDFADVRDVVQRLADVAAQTLEHAAIFEQMEQRGRLTRELADLGSSLTDRHDEHAIADELARRLLSVLRVSRCDVFVVREGLLWCLATAAADGSRHAVSLHPIPLDRNPTTAAAIADDRPRFILDPGDPRLSSAERDALALAGFRSEAVIPVPLDDEAPVIIDLLDVDSRDLQEYADFLRSAAQSLASALRRVRLRQQLERRNAILRDIVELGAQAGQPSGGDTTSLLRGVARRLLSTIDATCCDIFTLDETGLRCRVSLDQKGFDDSLTGGYLDLDTYPLTATALQTGAPFVVPTPDDPRLTELERADLVDNGYHSEFGIPLTAADRVVGFLDLFDTRRRDYAEYLDFARSVAQIVAGAIDNALLLQTLKSTARDQSALAEAALEFGSSLDIQAILSSVASRACAAAGADSCDIARIRDGQTTLLVSVLDGRDTGEAGAESPLAHAPAFADIAHLAEAQVTVDLLSDQNGPALDSLPLHLRGMRSCAHIPLLAGGDVIGVISLFARRPSRFESLDLLRGLAQLAAQALANADLHAVLRLRSDEAEILNALARRVAAAREPAESARMTLEALHDLLPFDRAAAFLADGTGALRPTCFEPALATDDPPGHDALTPSPLTRHADDRRASTPAVVPITPSDLDRTLLARWPTMRDGLLCRLDGSAGSLGLLVLGSTTQRAYSTHQQVVLQRAATHLSIAIENARRYDALRQLHVQNLRALVSALSSADDYSLGHAARVAGYLTLLGRQLHWSGRLMSQLEDCGNLHDIGKIGISERVFRTAAPLSRQDRELIERHPAAGADILDGIFDAELVAAVRHHHERFDGSGYPSGLAGSAIPPLARAMAVADAYDAISYPRARRDALTYQACRDELERCSGSQFDPETVAAFLRALDGLAHLRRATHRAARLVAEDITAALTSSERLLEGSSHDRLALDALLSAAARRHPLVDRLSVLLPAEGRLTLLAQAGPRATELDRRIGAPLADPLGLATQTDDPVRLHNVLSVDGGGTWTTSAATVRDDDGCIAAVITADVSMAHSRDSARSSDGMPTFTAMVHSTAERLGRASLDAITDSLTGLYNHRYLQERLAEELERAREAAGQLSLLFIDIDRFKGFNDTYGHSVGDAALRAVASAIEHAVRHVDLAARYGGEEFVVALVDTDAAGAIEVADRIRRAIAASDVGPGIRHVSASIGVATFPDDAEQREELIDKADWAMYAAKRGGRDRVRSFSSGQLRFDLGQTEMRGPQR